MVAPIINALSKGFTASSVLRHVLKKYPKFAKFAGYAAAAGFSQKTILKKIVNPSGEDKLAHKITTMAADTMDAQDELRRKDRLRPIKALGTVGAVIGGVAALSKLGKAASTAKAAAAAAAAGTVKEVQNTASTPENITPSISPEREKLLKIADNLPEEKPKVVVGEGIKPLQIDVPIVKVPRIETQFPHVKKYVDKHLEAGLSPEEIYNNMQDTGLKGIVQRYEEKEGKSYLDRIKELSGGRGVRDDDVITPMGAGVIHNEKGDNAFVKIDNKLHKIPKDELEEPPMSAVEAVTNYLNIPEKDRSSNVALFAWNPDEKRAYFQFHNEDSFYEYTDVDPAVVDAIAEKRAIPKTEGGNEYGVWSPDDQESIGAALWKYIISTPKYAKTKKGEEANPYYKKLPVKYDYWKSLRKPTKRKK